MQNLKPRTRWITWGLAALLAALVLWCFPLFHVVRIDAQGGSTKPAVTPESIAGDLWRSKILPAAPKAPDAGTVFSELRSNFTAARAKYTHRVGVGGPYFLFITGTAHITAKTDRLVTLKLNYGGGNMPDLNIPLGILFGNTVRDGCGLLDVNTFENSQDYNNLSEALNAIVESTVLPKLRQSATTGKEIHFAGICEMDEDDTALKTLDMVPVFLEVK